MDKTLRANASETGRTMDNPWDIGHQLRVRPPARNVPTRTTTCPGRGPSAWIPRLCCSSRSFIRPPQHTPSDCSQAPFWAPGAKHQRGRRDSRPHPTVRGTSRGCEARDPSCGMSHTEGRVTPSGGAVLFGGIIGLNRSQEQTPAHPTV